MNTALKNGPIPAAPTLAHHGVTVRRVAISEVTIGGSPHLMEPKAVKLAENMPQTFVLDLWMRPVLVHPNRARVELQFERLLEDAPSLEVELCMGEP